MESDADVAALVDKSSGYYFIIFFYIVGHVNLDLSYCYIVQGHTQIIMDFSSGDFHFPHIILVLCLEVLYKRISVLWNFVGYLHGIHIPNYIHLMTVDYFIGYTDSIRVDGENLLK